MKKIGTTENGGVLVEMSQDEVREFSRLADAVGGETWNSEWTRYGATSVAQDYSGTFGVIRAFYAAKFGFNQLRALAQDFDDFLNLKG